MHIEKKAFEDCSALSEVTIKSPQIAHIGAHVFLHCKSLKRINVPDSAMDKYKSLLPKYLHKKLVQTEKDKDDCGYSPALVLEILGFIETGDPYGFDYAGH